MSNGDFNSTEPGTAARGATGATGPAGPAPTGSGNQVLATPSDGSSGVSALRAIVVADIATALAAGGNGIKGTTLTATTRTDTPTVGTSSGAQHALPSGTNVLSQEFFGTGNDGAVVLDGVNTFSWASLAGSTYTLTRTVMATTVVINSGIILVTANFGVYATVSLTNAGTIHNNGNSASGATGGGIGTVRLYQRWNGGQSGGTTIGSSGGTTTALGGSGGAGGNGTSGSGGAGGIVTSPADSQDAILILREFFNSNAQGFLFPGVPGGSGGGNGASAGGGAGTGGGFLMIKAQTIVNTGTISANGGNGGNGAASNCGGGGGGGGGVVSLIYFSLSNSGTIQAAGGNAGLSGGGSGTDGTSGSSGKVWQRQL